VNGPTPSGFEQQFRTLVLRACVCSRSAGPGPDALACRSAFVSWRPCGVCGADGTFAAYSGGLAGMTDCCGAQICRRYDDARLSLNGTNKAAYVQRLWRCALPYRCAAFWMLELLRAP